MIFCVFFFFFSYSNSRHYNRDVQINNPKLDIVSLILEVKKKNKKERKIFKKDDKKVYMRAYVCSRKTKGYCVIPEKQSTE